MNLIDYSTYSDPIILSSYFYLMWDMWNHVLVIFAHLSFSSRDGFACFMDNTLLVDRICENYAHSYSDG